MKTRCLFFVLLFLSYACSEKELTPISEGLGKPGIVTDIEIEPSHGGAMISYKIPNTEDLLAVKGVYTVSNGSEREVIASFYENKLQIQGYHDTLEHVVKLYAVNRAMELSDPVEVTFRPLESPLSMAIKSITIEADFGGARFDWRNPVKKPLNIELLAPDSLGRMSTISILTSDIDKNTYSIRGYDPKPYRFSMIISDNFDNASDTISAELVPLFEERLDKKKYAVLKLDNDAAFTEWGSLNSHMFDDDLSTFGHTANNAIPAGLTIDLGTTAKLSRFVMHQRLFGDAYYNHGSPKKMEIYTCDHRPSQSGNWSEWTKVMECEIVKPSGSPGDIVTDLDMEVARNGHEFSFDLSQAPMRYVRILFLSTWGGTSYVHPAEIAFYGEEQP